MRALNIPKLRRINCLGVELEGGWDGAPAGYEQDGSVECCGEHTGEVHSAPLHLEPLLYWIPRHYPEYSDDTCGFHVHFSLKDVNDYLTLTDRSFYNFFRSRLNTWGKTYPITNPAFWHRLDGKNTYCKKDFLPEKQIYREDKSGTRYTQLNYCYGLHGTIECRVFPMFQRSSVAQAAVCQLVDIVETYLLMHPPVKGKLTIPISPTAKDLRNFNPWIIEASEKAPVKGVRTFELLSNDMPERR